MTKLKNLMQEIYQNGSMEIEYYDADVTGFTLEELEKCCDELGLVKQIINVKKEEDVEVGDGITTTYLIERKYEIIDENDTDIIDDMLEEIAENKKFYDVDTEENKLIDDIKEELSKYKMYGSKFDVNGYEFEDSVVIEIELSNRNNMYKYFTLYRNSEGIFERFEIEINKNDKKYILEDICTYVIYK